MTRTTILKLFLGISYEVLSFEAMHYEFHLQLYHPTPLTTTTSTTGYFVLPKISALSQFTFGTVPKAHEEQNGLPGASKPYFSVRSLSGILYTNFFPHGLDIFNLNLMAPEF